jgi:phenylpropionate dioxygenase-like ring-hydroxylating dioxygenase large terminal subunit
MKLFLILSTLYQTSALLFHALQTIRRNAPELDCNYYSSAPRPSCMSPPLNQSLLSEQDKYDLGWYVVANKKDIRYNKPFQATIWNKNYVIWKNATSGEIHGLDDVCPHKGASLAGGKIVKGCVTCPYHGYEYNGEGTLAKIPGINFTLSAVHNVAKYHVIEKNGWVYLNTNPYNASLDVNIFEEPEAVGGDFSSVFLEMDFNCYSRILSENSLDVMHIAFVHTFGNAEKPAPLEEYPPTQISPYHFKTAYLYESGKQSMVKKVFDIKTLRIENEFVLPHTTVARVIFDKYISTVITFALPISETRSKLFVKTYRNFWNNELGDIMTEKMMRTTMLQDKAVVENIDMRYMEGKFNMKYDKLQNTYKTFYKRFVHRFCDGKEDNKTIDN